MSTRTIIDADGLILGRMASVIAKRLLAGETIDLVNAQNVVISGNKSKLVEDWKAFVHVGGFGKGPVHHRRPHEIVRRTVRGMLPYRIPKGEAAYKRLHVHLGVPDEFQKADKEKMPECHSENLNHRYVTVGELAESIGWNKMGVE